MEAARRADEAEHQARIAPQHAATFDIPTRRSSSATATPAALLDFDHFDHLG